jgi:tetratricopeptide (TPR) repeat protein
MSTFSIKPIREDAIPEALEKAERYRLLNDPAQAESICRDILRLKPDHQEALVAIVLALTDQLSSERGAAGARLARDYAARLDDEYRRLYYRGLIGEREARALLARGITRRLAYDGLREAMELYEQAERIRPPDNDDAILRWNSCVRTIRRERLSPRSEEEEPLLLE